VAATEQTWGDLFAAALPGSPPCAPSLARTVTRKVKDAVDRWPSMAGGAEPFLAHLAALVPQDVDDLEAYLGGLRVADLYLAFHCSHGDPVAVEAFEQTCLPQTEAVMARVNTPAALRDEVRQILRERLLVGVSGRPPSLASYAGRGSLNSWVRISALREVYRYAEQHRRWSQVEDDELERVAAPDNDPELAYLKSHYRQLFKEAFAAAMAALSPRQRNILRHYYLDGMSIDQIGALYRFHRATAARELGRIRRALLEGTRQAMMDGLRVGPGECESILRLIESRMEVSICSLLDDEPG